MYSSKLIKEVVNRPYLEILWMILFEKNQHPIEENIRIVYEALRKCEKEQKTYFTIRKDISERIDASLDKIKEMRRQISEHENRDRADPLIKKTVRDIVMEKIVQRRLNKQISSIDNTLALQHSTEEKLHSILLDFEFQLTIQRENDNKLDVSSISIRDIQLQRTKLLRETNDQKKQLEKLQSILNSTVESFRDEANDIMIPLEEEVFKELGL